MADDKKKILPCCEEGGQVNANEASATFYKLCLTVLISLVLLSTLSVCTVVSIQQYRGTLTPHVTHELVDVGEKDTALAAVDITDTDQTVVEYVHVTGLMNNQQQTWAISDFSRGIQIFRVVREPSAEAVCYVTPLIDLGTLSPVDLVVNSRQQSLKPDLKPETVIRNFDALPTPIKDKTFLGSKGRAMCERTSVYWMVPKYTENGPRGDVISVMYSGITRHRRDIQLTVWRPDETESPPEFETVGALRMIDRHNRPRSQPPARRSRVRGGWNQAVQDV
jgi:hypothetical protein